MITDNRVLCVDIYSSAFHSMCLPMLHDYSMTSVHVQNNAAYEVLRDGFLNLSHFFVLILILAEFTGACSVFSINIYFLSLADAT